MNAQTISDTPSRLSIWYRLGSVILDALLVGLLMFQQVAWAYTPGPVQRGTDVPLSLQKTFLESNVALVQQWAGQGKFGEVASANNGADGTSHTEPVHPTPAKISSTAIQSSNNPAPIGPDPGKGYVRLPGHVLDALARATPIAPDGVVPLSSAASAGKEPITLTLVLRRDDQAGFDHYMKEVYDPHSKIYRHFLTQAQITKKFGPSRKGYEQVLSYLRGQGFKLLEGSKNRMTMVVRGARANAEKAFDLNIGDYKIGDAMFYANDRDPAFPKALASHVQALSGLSDFAQPHPVIQTIQNAICAGLSYFAALVFQISVSPLTYKLDCWLTQSVDGSSTLGLSLGGNTYYYDFDPYNPPLQEPARPCDDENGQNMCNPCLGGVKAVLTASPTMPTTGDVVSFVASKSASPDCAPITSYIFNFGDGTPALTQVVPDGAFPGPPESLASHTYSQPGNYVASVTVVADVSATVSVPIDVVATTSNLERAKSETTHVTTQTGAADG
ncbi:MAG: protease pro-enzyme activation domain-containing protein, partial [Stenotrophobium sp.]